VLLALKVRPSLHRSACPPHKALEGGASRRQAEAFPTSSPMSAWLSFLQHLGKEPLVSCQKARQGQKWPCLFFCLSGLPTFAFYDKKGQFLCLLRKFYLRITSNGINKLINKIFFGIKIAFYKKRII